MACGGGVHLPSSGESGILCAGGKRDGDEKVHVQFCPLEPTQKRCRGLPGLAQALAHLKILNTGRGILLCECLNPGLADNLLFFCHTGCSAFAYTIPGPLTHLCDLEVGYAGVWAPNFGGAAPGFEPRTSFFRVRSLSITLRGPLLTNAFLTSNKVASRQFTHNTEFI